MRRKDRSASEPHAEEALLFELPPKPASEPELKQLPYPIWTENKARLIARYLYLFEQITKHGTYIDGFAGPQEPDKPETWAAKLALEIEPKLFRHFYFFEKSKSGYDALKFLRASQQSRPDREIEIFHGDFNIQVRKLLESTRIKQKEATFCLLDQWTFECHWRTVQRLALYKTGTNYKIELFYFLAAWWYRRAVSAIKKEEVLQAWWGRDDWVRLRNMKLNAVKDEFVARFKSELNYRFCQPWPIYNKSGSDMYFMIHATDHEEAPKLMGRAYEEAVLPTRGPEQSKFWAEDPDD